MTRPQPKWPTTPSPQYIRKRSSAPFSTFTKGQRKGEACVNKIFKSGSVFEATFFATSISADTPPSDVDNPILLEAGGITLTVTPEHIVPVIAAT